MYLFILRIMSKKYHYYVTWTIYLLFSPNNLLSFKSWAVIWDVVTVNEKEIIVFSNKKKDIDLLTRGFQTKKEEKWWIMWYKVSLNSYINLRMFESEIVKKRDEFLNSINHTHTRTLILHNFYAWEIVLNLKQKYMIFFYCLTIHALKLSIRS